MSGQYLLRRLAEEEAALASLGPQQASRPAKARKQFNGRFALKQMSPPREEKIMSGSHQVRSTEFSSDLDDLLHPASAFEHPRDVVRDPDLTLNEKRAILSSWASDACAVDSAPALRRTPKGTIVTFDDVVDALRDLDAEAAKARWSPSHRVARSLRSRRSSYEPSRGQSGRSLQ